MNGPSGDFKYWVIISYSHAHQVWGMWLHRALETYRAPRALAGRPELVARVVAALEAQGGRLTVIVEKIRAATLARSLLPLPDSDRYAIPRYVRRHFREVGETRFFELYR